MNYFEATGYGENQNRKDITWEEVRNLPVYAMTKAGIIWQGHQKLSPSPKMTKPCYIVLASRKPIALYFFEKATIGGKQGVKLHVAHKWFPRAQDSYDFATNDRGMTDRWVFITPDWKVYDMKGDKIEIKNLRCYEQYAPCFWDFKIMRNYAHDLRIVGRFKEGFYHCEACGQMLSPATVDILKEVGFDMEPMYSTWEIQSKYAQEVPQGSYKTSWFIDNLMHPNRVARRKKGNSLVKHDYEYYLNLMGDKNFLVFEEDGQIYVAQKEMGFKQGVTISYLKMLGRKAPACAFYSTKGKKKLMDNSIRSVLACNCDWRNRATSLKNVCADALGQLLEKRKLLERTEVFKNLMPTLEEAKKNLDGADATQIADIYNDLSYVLSPAGQKDRVFEETVKQNGLGDGITAFRFLDITGESFDMSPDLKQKTPYKQEGLTKQAYYELMKFAESGVSISLGSMVHGLAKGDDGWMNSMSREEYKSERAKLCPYLTADFLELLRKETMGCRSFLGMHRCGLSAVSWGSLLRLAGKNFSDPLPEKVAAVTRMLKRFESDPSLAKAVEEDRLRDYYRQVDELAPLGIDWPQKYEEFHVKNIMWFLGTVRRNPDLVEQAKSLIPDASFGRRIEILHELQNQISALSRLELEKAALREMDKQYDPWKEQLKKALEWKGENFGVFIPESLAELTLEGSALHHCVGSYKRDVALRREGILFLRKLSRPDTPYYTLDVVKEQDGKYRVRQCHGNCNCNPTPEVVAALKQWAADTGKVDEGSISDAYGALCCL